MTFSCQHLSGLSLLALFAVLPAAQAQDSASIKFSGRLYYDVARFDNDGRGKPERDNDDLRAAWLAASGKLYGFDYKLEGDFAGHRPVARDVYLARSFGSTTLTLGQFKQYFTLDDRASTNHIPTIERSWLAQTLAPTYRLGLGITGYDQQVFWSGSLYSLESIDAWKVKGRGFGARAGYAPWKTPGQVLHFGAAVARGASDSPGSDGVDDSVKTHDCQLLAIRPVQPQQ
jgi:phosphate-selective porin OprO/OprP